MAGTAFATRRSGADGVRVTGLRRSFGAVRALDGIDLVARAGAITALVGPNGSGKTTLLLTLAGLLRPNAGQVRVAGVDPVRDGRAARTRTGWMPDVFGAWESLTVREVLATVATAYRLERAAARGRTADVLAAVGLTRAADTPAHVLPRGDKQRLGLARALIHDPDVLLLDEPAAGLDPRSRDDQRELLRSLAGAGRTVVVSSNVLTDLDGLADDAVFLARGRAVAMESLAATAPAPRAWRLCALDAAPLADWLAQTGIPFTPQDDGAVLVEIDGEAGAAVLLRDAVAAAVPLVSFAPAGSRFESRYRSLEEDRS